ncbi:MAG: hypothetical protein R2720_00955 [Candidatus Nanopelagicales bacterium]
MTLRDALPIRRCAEPACPFLGPWPLGGYCPDHRDPLDRIPGLTDPAYDGTGGG